MGRKTSETDPNGNETKYSYDKNGRLASVSAPFSNYGEMSSKEYVYDNNGNIIEEKTKVTSSQDRVTKTEYNYLGKATKIGI